MTKYYYTAYFLIIVLIASCSKNRRIQSIEFSSVFNSTDIIITDSSYVLIGESMFSYNKEDGRLIQVSKSHGSGLNSSELGFQREDLTYNADYFINYKSEQVAYSLTYEGIQPHIPEDSLSEELYFDKYSITECIYLISNSFQGSFVTKDCGASWIKLEITRQEDIHSIGHYHKGFFMVTDNNDVHLYNLEENTYHLLFEGDTIDLYDEIIDMSIYDEDTALLTRNGTIYERSGGDWKKKNLLSSLMIEEGEMADVNVEGIPDSLLSSSFLIRASLNIDDYQVIAIINLEEEYSLIAGIDENGGFYISEKLDGFILNGIKKVKETQLIVTGNSLTDNRSVVYLGTIIYEDNS